MKRTSNLALYYVSVWVVLLWSSILWSQTVRALETMPVDQVRPGMKGYGLTVFSGTEPERFEVEVVSVVPNFNLRQDIILVMCKHPVTDLAGVIGGMSGSPIFLEGKLVGALAYGWRFGKEPLAGVTAIDDMLDVARRRPRDRKITPMGKGHSVARALGTLRHNEGTDRAQGLKRDRPGEFFSQFLEDTSSDIVMAHTPLTLGGFLGQARQILQNALSAFGIDPVVGGGSGKGAAGKDSSKKAQFVPGGAIGVQLIRGDMSATAVGTVTTVVGKNVLAFGHPMFNMGEGYLPVTTAEIHTVIASMMRSNKLGSPLEVAGTLVQDRNAGIVARTDEQAKMIPVKIAIEDTRSKRTDTYEVEVALHRLLTPRFVQAALVNVITHAASDVTDVTAEMTGTMKIEGRAPMVFRDSGASRAGLAQLAGFFRPVGLVAEVLDNPFEDVMVEALEYQVKLHYGLKRASIVGAYVTSEDPAPGDIINVHVRLRQYNSSTEKLVTVPVRIPLNAAGQKIRIEIAGGDFISPPMPVPQNLDDLLANVQQFYPPQNLVVGLNLPGEGVSVRGRIMERLPQSVVNALSPVAGQDQIDHHRTALREVVPTDYLVEGKEQISLTVGGLKSR